MPKDNEICLDHFEDLIDDGSPLKSLIDRRIVPSNDKRVKIVGTKRPDVRDFFNNFNELTQSDQENGSNQTNDDKLRQKSTINNISPIVTPPPQSTVTINCNNQVNKEGGKTSLGTSTNYHKINNKNHNLSNNNHLIYNENEINGSVSDGLKVKIGENSSSSSSTLSTSSSSSSSSSSINQLINNGNIEAAIVNTNDSSSSSSISVSGVTLSPEISVNTNSFNPTINSFANKSDKRLSDHEGGFKFIKWTANHRGYKINPTNKRSTWFSDSTREDDESATIVSLKIKSIDPTIGGESYHHFVNQNVPEVVKHNQQRLSTSSTSKQEINKLSSSLGLGEQFVRARSNSSPEAKESSILVNGNLNDKLNRDEIKSSNKGYNHDNSGTNHSKELNETNCNQSNNQTSEKKRIGEIIRNLLRRRPTLDEIREKGILIDGPVFGCDLTTLCNREGQLVPKILQYCIEAIEVKGLQTDGLYRICGNLSEVQKIRFQVNHGNYDTIWSQENVHAVTGVLKLFLRDLKEPLLPFDLFNSFIFTTGIPNKKDQIEALQKLINQLPKCNYHTLIFLLKHLLRVVQYQDKNRMQIQNLSIIFGPTLMWPRTESNDFSYDMMLRVHCNRIVEILLTEFNAIFMVSMTSV